MPRTARATRWPTRFSSAALTLLLASGAAAPAFSQAPPPRGGRGNPPRDVQPSAEAEPLGTSSIVGTVVIAGSGAPARRARVSLSGEALRGGRSVTTDDQGRYAFNSLPAGRFTLTASKAGHLPVSYGQRVPGSGRPGTPIQLADAQRLNIRLEMPRGGVISGTVLDEHGDPVTGTQVRAFRYALVGGVRTLQQAGGDATDDRGIYRIYGMLMGDYVIGATPRGSGPPTPGLDRLQEAVASLAPRAGGRGQPVAAAVLDRIEALQGGASADGAATGYAPVYYPGTTNAGAASAIPLNVGEERLGVDFQLQLVPMARVEGMVIAPAGQESGGLQVQLVNLAEEVGAPGGNSTRIDREGKFTFSNVAPGQYTLLARSGGPLGFGGPDGPGGRGGRGAASGSRLWATTDLTVDGRNLSNVVVTLQPGLVMSGRLEFRGTAAQPPADLTRLRVTLTPADPSGAGRQLASAAIGRVDDSGRFTIEGVVPGRYRLNAGGTGNWSLESAVVGGQDAVDFPLEIRSGQNLSGAVVTFSDRQTTLSGTVTNAQGQPVSDYTLIVYPADQRYRLPQSRRIRSIRPATDGTFSLIGLPPGDYRIAPALDPEPGSWFDPAVLQQLDAGSEPFTLTDGEKKVQNLRAGG